MLSLPYLSEGAKPMQKSGQKPDFVSFTNLLSKKGSIESRSRIIVTKLDWSIMRQINGTLLGSVGKLEETYYMLKKMPFEPHACVWGALLSSCRLLYNMSLCEVDAGKIVRTKTNNTGNYIMSLCSWIEVKTKVHMLLADDKSFPQMAQTLDKLQNELGNEESGLLATYLLCDARYGGTGLCGHNEKLAVAFWYFEY